MPFLPLALLTVKELVWATALLLVFALAVAVALLGPRNRLDGRRGAALPMKSLGSRPILQLELVRNEKEISDVLLAGDWRANVADARAGNRIDTWLFIPAYGGFLLLTAVLLARGGAPLGRGLFWFCMIAVCTLVVCDWIENAGIERALRHIEASGTPHPGDAAAIRLPACAKWVLLAVVLLVFAVSAFRQPGIPGRLFGVALLAAGAGIACTLFRYFREPA